MTVAVPAFGTEKMDKSLTTGLEFVYLGAMYDFFIGADADGQLSTDLGVLESVTTADGQTYTFKLKPGVAWHDGAGVTSQDIKFSMEHYAREDASCVSCGFLRGALESIEVVDTLTATMTLSAVNISLIQNLGPLEGDLAILPKHHFDKVGIDGGFEDDPLGSGPYRFADRSVGISFEFEANTEYWDESRTPTIASLKIIVASDSGTRVALLRTGEVDIAEIDNSAVAGLVSRGFNINGPEAAGSVAFMFLQSYDPTKLTNNLDFRKALIQSVDWLAIAQAFYAEEQQEIALGTALFTPVAVGYDPSLPPYPFDQAEAQRFLDKSGYSGQKITFWSWQTTGNPAGLDVPQAITSAWREIGVSIDIVPLDQGAFVGKVLADPQDFDTEINVTMVSPSARPSMLTNIRIFMNGGGEGKGFVQGYWDSDKINTRHSELVGITDDQERENALRALNREIYDEYWAAPIAIKNVPYGVGDRIAAWEPGNGVPINLRWETLKLK